LLDGNRNGESVSMYDNQIRGIGAAAGMGYLGGGSVLAQDCVKLASEPPRNREVPEQTERLEKAISFAQDSMNELVARLEYVTRPTGPEPANGCQTVAAGPSTAYGGHLSSLGYRVNALGERIQDLLRRLEV
jgi:hypothetical protein